MPLTNDDRDRALRALIERHLAVEARFIEAEVQIAALREATIGGSALRASLLDEVTASCRTRLASAGADAEADVLRAFLRAVR